VPQPHPVVAAAAADDDDVGEHEHQGLRGASVNPSHQVGVQGFGNPRQTLAA